MIKVEDATESDIFNFIHNIRDMDKEEIYLATNQNIVDAMRDWRDYNTQAVWCDNDLIGVGGIKESDDDNSARVWLLLTNKVLDHKIEFLRWSKEYHDSLLEKYAYVFNTVYTGNILHIKYLKWLGAHFYPFADRRWAFFVIKREE